MIKADVICHSRPVGTNGNEDLITMEVEFHRFILAEINTHRVLSRNYQSSRAVPVEKLIEQVRNDPAIPVHWGKNQRGMVADEENNTEVKFTVAHRKELIDGVGQGYWFEECGQEVDEFWISSARKAAFAAEAMHRAGYHKQIVNRLLEPFMWTRGVITATRAGWDSVFALRCHPDAQPEFQALAYKIKEAIDNSTPKILEFGEWHLPYVNSYKYPLLSSGKEFSIEVKHYTGDIWSDAMQPLTMEEAIKISTSCCAQVSYRQLDDGLEKALKIYDMLNLPANGVFSDKPAHMSPCEHQAMYSESNIGLAGNFGTLGRNNWVQYRKMLEHGYEDTYIKGSK